jgi:hypothetical protein
MLIVKYGRSSRRTSLQDDQACERIDKLELRPEDIDALFVDKMLEVEKFLKGVA